MVKESILQLLLRDLHKLRQEIASYQDEAVIWQTINGISNSAGNLCLHLVGNLNTYIGKVLGGTGYVRNRDQEFSLRNIPQQVLLEEIDKVMIVIENTFEGLSDEQLFDTYPEDVFGEPMSTQFFLVHLQGHLNYHLGQINYHRRILSSIRSQVESFLQMKAASQPGKK